MKPVMISLRFVRAGARSVCSLPLKSGLALRETRVKSLVEQVARREWQPHATPKRSARLEASGQARRNIAHPLSSSSY